jgi:nitroreductase
LGYILDGRLCIFTPIRAEVLIMDILEAIRGRRSIRKYNPDPLSDEMLDEVLEAVRWAPSWANTQCWEVIVIREPEIKARVAETLPPPLLPEGCARPSGFLCNSKPLGVQKG